MSMKQCWVVMVSFLVALTYAQTPVGGENFGIPLANLPIPYDKCSISAANDANMQLTAVAWGYNNEYWVSKQDPNWGAFGAWKSIGGFFSGGPTVIRNSFNDLVVFGRGADRKVWYKVLRDNSDEDWTPLGGKLLSGRILAVLDPQGLIHVFAQGKDSAVWEKRQFANGTTAVWGDWTSLGGVFSSNTAGIVDAEGIIHLFSRGIDGFLWKLSQKLEDDGSLTWVTWANVVDTNVLLSSSSTIVAQLNAQNLVELFVRGADKAFWHTRQTVNDERGVIFSPWKSLGGIFASAASSQMSSSGLLTVFGRGPEKGIWYKVQAHHPVDSPSDAWSKWTPLGGRFSAGVDTALDSRGYINLFGRGLDRSIWTRGQMYSNHTVGFFGPWTNLQGRFRAFQC